MTAFYKSQPLLWRAILAILFAFGYLYVEAHAAPNVRKPVAAPHGTPTTFDHSKFNAALALAVSNGYVDYTRFKTNAGFNAYLTSLETATIAAFSSNERLAFWINAYNALVIKNILDNPGIKHPTDVKGFFDTKKFKVAGQMLTLNDIENTMIRQPFHDPLIHFGLVCAARSCPPLQSSVYTASTVHTQLAHNATAYLSSAYNRFDAGTNSLVLSQIFNWYKSDFGGDAGIRTFVKTYGSQAMIRGLATAPNAPIQYMTYDWTLNGKY